MRKFISLLSGGLDSSIAAYLMIKRGFIPVFLSFLTSDDSNHSMKYKVIDLVKLLSRYTDNELKIHIINHDYNLEAFKQFCDRKLTCVLCKRLMLRTAKRLGSLENTNIIVTGDILGEQASQTLDNLYSYNNIIQDFIVLRPLIGCDKQEVINMNKKIGSYEVSSIPSAGCKFNPQYPETHAKLHEIQHSESKINIFDLVENSIENAEVLKF
ncbi:putative tRNA sulfurtransferase [subsurface metagenome]